MSHYLSFNKVLFVGRIAKDPELKQVKEKQSHLSRVTLVTQELFYSPSKDKYETRPEWHICIAWGKRAEFIGNKLKKGRIVVIEGKLRHRYYDDEKGERRKISQVEVENIIPLPFGKPEEVEEPQEEEKESERDPF